MMGREAPERPERLVEYFVRVGVGDELDPLDKSEICKTALSEAPIVALAVIQERDPVPRDFVKVEYTVSGGVANLNSGNMFSSNGLYLCYRRSFAEPALTDVVVIFPELKEKCPPAYDQLPVNLNKGSYGRSIYLCYSTKGEMSPIVDVGIVSSSLNEQSPAGYSTIHKNLNAGSFRDEIYLCVKRMDRSALATHYKPVILDRFPRRDLKDSPLPPAIAMFCHPEGCLLMENPPHLPTTSTFVLTIQSGLELYGACLTFYEEWYPTEGDSVASASTASNSSSPRTSSGADDEGPETQPELPPKGLHLGISDNDNGVAVGGAGSGGGGGGGGGGGDGGAVAGTGVPAGHFAEPPDFKRAITALATQHGRKVYAPVSICLVSYWPFFDCFTDYLCELYRLSVGKTRVPIERYLTNLWETPLPRTSRINVQLSIGRRKIVFDRPPADDFPQANFSFKLLFQCLSKETVVTLMAALLLEHKVVLCSKSRRLLTPVAESLRALIFPFQWQYAYVPVLPKFINGILEAPMPILVGVHTDNISQKIYQLEEACIVDLDNNRIINFGQPICPLPPPVTKILLRDLDLHVHTDAVPPLGDAFDVPELFLPGLVAQSGHGFFFPGMGGSATPPPSSSLASSSPMSFGGAASSASRVSGLRTPTGRAASYAKGLPSFGIGGGVGGGEYGAFKELACRAAFVRFFVKLLGDYKKYLTFPVIRKCERHMSFDDLFRRNEYMESLPRSSRTFMSAFLNTQTFANLIDELTYSSPRQSDLEFFDQCRKYESDFESALARLRSSHGVPAAPTLVQHLSELRNSNLVYVVPKPDATGLDQDSYEYERFPKLSLTLFRRPRAVNLKYMKDVSNDRRRSLASVFDDAFNSSPNRRGVVASMGLGLSADSSDLGLGKHSPRLSYGAASSQAFDTPKDLALFRLQYVYATWFQLHVTCISSHLNVEKATLDMFLMLDRMVTVGIVPDERIYRAVLIICGKYRKRNEARVIFETMKSFGVTPTSVTYGAYAGALAEGMDLVDSHQNPTHEHHHHRHDRDHDRHDHKGKHPKRHGNHRHHKGSKLRRSATTSSLDLQAANPNPNPNPNPNRNSAGSTAPSGPPAHNRSRIPSSSSDWSLMQAAISTIHSDIGSQDSDVFDATVDDADDDTRAGSQARGTDSPRSTTPPIMRSLSARPAGGGAYDDDYRDAVADPFALADNSNAVLPMPEDPLQARVEGNGEYGFIPAISSALLDDQRVSRTEDLDLLAKLDILDLSSIRMGSHNFCMACHRDLGEADVLAGWTDDPNDYTTKCIACHNNLFVPKLQVGYRCRKPILLQVNDLRDVPRESLNSMTLEDILNEEEDATLAEQDAPVHQQRSRRQPHGHRSCHLHQQQQQQRQQQSAPPRNHQEEMHDKGPVQVYDRDGVEQHEQGGPGSQMTESSSLGSISFSSENSVVSAPLSVTHSHSGRSVHSGGGDNEPKPGSGPEEDQEEQDTDAGNGADIDGGSDSDDEDDSGMEDDDDDSESTTAAVAAAAAATEGDDEEKEDCDDDGDGDGDENDHDHARAGKGLDDADIVTSHGTATHTHGRTDSQTSTATDATTSTTGRGDGGPWDDLQLEHRWQEMVIEVPLLSPVVLRKELETAARTFHEDFLHPELFRCLHKVLYWNLMWHYTNLSFPMDFLVPFHKLSQLRVQPLSRRDIVTLLVDAEDEDSLWREVHETLVYVSIEPCPVDRQELILEREERLVSLINEDKLTTAMVLYLEVRGHARNALRRYRAEQQQKEQAQMLTEALGLAGEAHVSEDGSNQGEWRPEISTSGGSRSLRAVRRGYKRPNKRQQGEVPPSRWQESMFLALYRLGAQKYGNPVAFSLAYNRALDTLERQWREEMEPQDATPSRVVLELMSAFQLGGPICNRWTR